MAGNGMGVTFIPSAANQLAQGPRQGSLEGDLGAAGGSDLGAAFKILNLRLPTILGARAPVARGLLTSPGAAGVPGALTPPGQNPSAAGGGDQMAAVFAALLRSMLQGNALPPSSSMGAPAMAGPVPETPAGPEAPWEAPPPAGPGRIRRPAVRLRDDNMLWGADPAESPSPPAQEFPDFGAWGMY